MRIVLIGLPGSGKSTLGKALAKELGLPFVDTDLLITQEENRSIENIFAESGEDYFRNIERKVLLDVLEMESAVISTGGGAPCFFDNMQWINSHAISIFIDPPVKAIVSRLLNDKINIRPMIAGKSEQQVFLFIEGKMKEREPFYSQAHIRLKEENISLANLITQVKFVAG